VVCLHLAGDFYRHVIAAWVEVAEIQHDGRSVVSRGPLDHAVKQGVGQLTGRQDQLAVHALRDRPQDRLQRHLLADKDDAVRLLRPRHGAL